MFLFLYQVSSTQYSLHFPVFNDVALKKGDSIYFNLDDKYTGIIFWKTKGTNFSNSILLYNKTNYRAIYNNINEKGYRFDGKNATITVNSDANALIWMIDRDICGNKIMFYRTSQGVNDNFVLSRSLDKLCVFFPDFQKNSKFEAEVSYKIGGKSSTISYYPSSILKPSTGCSKNKCSFQLEQPFFILFDQIFPHETVYIFYKMSKNLPLYSCEKEFTTNFKDSSMTIGGLIPESNILSCDLENNLNPKPIGHFFVF